MNKKIIISLLFLASSASSHLMCSEKIKQAPSHSLKQEGLGIANDLMVSVNKLQQDLQRAKVSLEGQPGSKAAKFALRNLMKMLDMILSQVVNFSKFFISDDVKVEVKAQRPSKLAEAGEDKESLKDGFAAPLLADTLKKKEKEEKKKRQEEKEKTLLGTVEKLQDEVGLLVGKLEQKNKEIKNLKKDKKNKDNSFVLRYTKGVTLNDREFKDRIDDFVAKDDVKGLAKLLSPVNTQIVKDAIVNGDYRPSLRAQMVVTPATQIINEATSFNKADEMTHKALFMYDYMNRWVKSAYEEKKANCLAFFEKNDPFGMNSFFCVKKNIGRNRTYESTIILDFKHQIQCWNDTQEIAGLLAKIYSH